MSLLSSPQGTPERVWSLVAGLSALGGSSQRGPYEDLLNPGFERDGAEVKAKAALASDAHNAALSLGLVESGRDQVSLSAPVPTDFAAFADLLHDRLAALEADGTDTAILEGYAWIAAESDRQGGVEWIYQTGRDAFADQANSGLSGKEMNTTRLPAWRIHPAGPALPGRERALLRTLLRAHSGAVDAADYGCARARASSAVD